MRPKIIAVYSRPLIRTHFRNSPYMHQHYDPTSDTNAQRDAMSQQERQTKSTRKVSSTCITKIGGLCGKSPRLNGQKHVLIGHSLYAPQHHQIGNCLHRTPKVLQSDIRASKLHRRKWEATTRAQLPLFPHLSPWTRGQISLKRHLGISTRFFIFALDFSPNR